MKMKRRTNMFSSHSAVIAQEMRNIWTTVLASYSCWKCGRQRCKLKTRRDCNVTKVGHVSEGKPLSSCTRYSVIMDRIVTIVLV